MKKNLQIASIFLIVLVVLAAAAVVFPMQRVSPSQKSLRFDSFSTNQPRIIHFSTGTYADLTDTDPSAGDHDRRMLDQLRDWCLLTIVSSSGLSPREVAESVYDLPAIRREDMRRVANFEYGETRSRVLGDGSVVALIPASPSERRRDNLAHIADEQRKNLGQPPRELIVFEYELAPDANQATITRRETMPGSHLFTLAYGYVEREVSSLDQLEAFIEATDDLVYAHKSKSGLLLGGRRRFRPAGQDELPYGRIGVEEVAAIWRGQQGLPEFQGCGFSLDPHLDMAKVARDFDSRIAPMLDRLDPAVTLQARTILDHTPTSTVEAQRKSVEFAQTLRSACEHSAQRNTCLALMSQLVWDNSFQTARYEGQHLAGTETGMILFYTDLLMKLWSFDLAESAPGHGRVAGFPILASMQVSPIFKTELDKAPETRLWLGPLNSGFQIAEARASVVFSPNSTRVFAQAHDFLTGQDKNDVPEPNFFERTFINWWNDHYEEIARFEPQYERLNQIVKWSVVISWLDLDGKSNLLRFLSEDSVKPVMVKRTNYFPQWVAKHLDARFKAWDQIQFDKLETARAENESLPILKSRLFPAFGSKMWWEGGVSLASRSAVEEAAVTAERLESLAPTARRADVDALRSDLSAGRLRMITATEYSFKSITDEAVSLLARAKPGARLTDAYGALENAGFERTIRSTSEGLLMRTRMEAEQVMGDFGDLRILRNADGFDVTWESREVDLGQSLARRLSTALRPAEALQANPAVDSIINMDGGKSWLVKVRGSERWIKFSDAASSDAEIARGFQARVAGIGDNARAIDVAWLDSVGMQAELPEDGYLVIARSKTATEEVLLECCARPPPPGSSKVVLERNGTRIAGFRDANGTTYFRTGDLPQSVRVNPSQLLDRKLSSEDFRIARNLSGGEYRELANELAQNPTEFRLRMDRILQEEIAYNEQLIARQQFRSALEHSQQLIETHGRLPELTYRRALLEASAGDVDGAAATLNSSLRRPIANSDRFLNEVNHRLQNARTVDEKINTARSAQFTEWNASATRSGEVVSFAENGHLHLSLRADRLPGGRTVTLPELQSAVSRQETFYLADSPLTSNLDPYIPQQQATLKQMLAMKQVTIREVEMMDVRTFHPAMLHEVSSSTSWRLADHGGQILENIVRYPVQQGKSCNDQEGSCHVYLVSPAAALQAPSVK